MTVQGGKPIKVNTELPITTRQPIWYNCVFGVLPMDHWYAKAIGMLPVLPAIGCQFCRPTREHDVIQDGVVYARVETRGINTIFPIMLKANEKKYNFVMTERTIQHVSTNKLSCK